LTDEFNEPSNATNTKISNNASWDGINCATDRLINLWILR